MSMATATAELPTGEALAERLAAFIAEQEPGVTEVEVSLGPRTAVGQSMENLVVDATWARDGARERRPLIVRREGPTNFTNGTRAGEFDVLRALEHTPVAAPKALWLDADGQVFGRPTIVMERAEGSANADALAEHGPLGSDAARRRQVGERLFDQLIALHTVDLTGLDLGRAVRRVDPDPASAGVESWWQLASRHLLEPLPELAEARHWLLANLQPSGRQVLVHGDFRPENVLLRGEEVAAVLDWELAHVGDPLVDLGWWFLPLFAHQHGVPGAWEQRDQLERYAAGTGLDVDPLQIAAWSVLGVFQIVAMLVCNQRGFVEGRVNQGFTWWYQQQLLHMMLAMMGM